MKKKQNKQFECFNCGRKSNYFGILYFSFKKLKVELCNTCWVGLAMGLKEDLKIYMEQGEQALKELIYESHKNDKPI